MTKSKGFTLIELMIVIAIIAIIAAIAIPGLLAAQRASNERNASASLKTIVSSEADFRSNDRDGDRQADFWVGDVYCLFALCPSTNGTAAPTPAAGNMIKLIEPSVAGADCSANVVAGAVPVASSVGTMTPKASYVYRVFDGDSQGLLGQSTALGYTACYNFGRFAFMAFPTSYSAGRQIFIVNEDNTIWRADPTSAYVATQAGTNWTFTGQILGTAFTDASNYPAAPGAAGFSKLD